MQPILEIRDLNIALCKKNAEPFYPVKHMNFSICEGETVALVGESGSGKTMTAMAIMGLLDAWNSFRLPQIGGEILFTDQAKQIHPLHRYKDAQFDRIRGDELSIIFQNPLQSLNPVTKIGEQLVGVIRSHDKLSYEKAKEKAVALLDEVGIPEPQRRYHDFPGQFSGGQLQRIMIAMAISGNTRCLIADEPTTALDVTIQSEILALLRRLQRERGMAILLITHDLGIVSNYADRVVVMYHGHQLEIGPVDSVFASPLHPYTKLLIDSVPSFDSLPQTRLSTKKDFLRMQNKAVRGRLFDPESTTEDTLTFVDSQHGYTPLFTREVFYESNRAI